MAFANGQVASIGITLHVRSQIHTLLILHLLFFLYWSFQNLRCPTLSGHVLSLKLLISYMTPVFIFLHSQLGGLLLVFSLLFFPVSFTTWPLTLITHWSQLLLKLYPIFLISSTTQSLQYSSYFTEKIKVNTTIFYKFLLLNLKSYSCKKTLELTIKYILM